MAREYTVTGDGLTISAANIQVFLNPVAAGATGTGFEVLRAWASQRANATSAQQGIQLGTKVTAFPTLTGATPAKTKLGDPISSLVSGTAGAAGTAGINASANGAGAEIAVYSDNFNVLNGWLWLATPAETMMFMPGGTSGFFEKFLSTPGTTTAWTVGVCFRELG